ncbi:MAG: hypothetical protein ACRDL6_03960 [Solirubrobacterales bacterium]
MARPLLVVDTPSLLFRAFYALPKSIKGPDGNPVELAGKPEYVLSPFLNQLKSLPVRW